MSTKKRKCKGNSSETVEGFNVFRNSASVVQSSGEVQADDESIELNKKKNKKEKNRQLKQDVIFRKRHNIHVSGFNVPSPLQNFDELKKRYNCPLYLFCNLMELGFKLPTPIQRQAIPVLLYGCECFECAPIDSGKTLAFVCPMFMKLKDLERGGIRVAILSRGRDFAFGIGRAFNSDLPHASDLGGRRFLGGLCLDVGGSFLAHEHWA
ncbi:hypothetical protein VNO80_10015 [Phaseolus coccineus]|uniref:ATP-dependent RNA helicase n=1 Tax=Phaseolus coccineus TaxID=3886 RepID=A0AAN9NCM6_PHACN